MYIYYYMVLIFFYIFDVLFNKCFLKRTLTVTKPAFIKALLLHILI